MRLPSKTLEKKLFAKGYQKIIAVDEVGIGSLAGPVVVCAVLFNKKFFKKTHKNLHWLRDSKLLTQKQREKFVKELLKVKDLKFKISFCYPKTIDRINIYQAARLAMRRAIKKLIIDSLPITYYRLKKMSNLQFSNPKSANSQFAINNKIIILVDGKNEIKGLKLKQMPIVKGDRRVFSIACASLIAKVFRDKMMLSYGEKFPEYGFDKNKGYGTKFHRAMLMRYGYCQIHRKSFKCF